MSGDDTLRLISNQGNDEEKLSYQMINNKRNNMTEEAVQMSNIGGDPGNPSDDAPGYEESKLNLSDTDQAKAELIKALLGKINMNNDDLVEISGLNDDIIASIRKQRYEESGKIIKDPLSWDYVLAFAVGDAEEKQKPTKKDLADKKDNVPDDGEWKDGMQQTKYNGQIMMDLWKRLEYAKLSIKAFKSRDGEMMFLLVGITETNLKYWADVRDADLLINPKGAIDVGVERKFPLALRTVQENERNRIDPSNWENLYVEYHPNADERIYTQYNRIKGDESIKTIFDEKTRLRIIYECITTDQNDGGAEIAVADLALDKKHPLVACFPLHDPDRLEQFDKLWIKNWRITELAWCPIAEIRDYFGEPVAFYFGFLKFYMLWLIPISIIGFIFFIMQMFGLGVKKVEGKQQFVVFDVPGLPIMGAVIIFWSVAFVDFWYRQEARYRMQWGMSNYSEKAVARPQFKGEWKPDPITGLFSEQFDWPSKLCRLSTVFSGLLFFLAICVAGVISVLIIKDGDPNNTGLKIGLGVANGVMIFIFNVIYKVSSGKGNDYENHKTQQDYEDALITKGFIFKFINSFASLIYLGFIRPGIKGLEYYVHYYNGVCGINSPGNAGVAVAEYLRVYNMFIENTSAIEWTSDFVDQQRDSNGVLIDYRPWRKPKKDYAYEASCMPDLDPKDPEGCVTKVFNDKAWIVGWEGFSYMDATGNSITVNGTCTLDDAVGEQNEAVLNELFFQLVSLFVTALVVQNFFEVGIPFLVGKCKGNAREKEAQKQGKEHAEPQSEAEEQAELAPYENTIEDMTELIVQFGYVTLFVIAFPLTPLLALLNNILEMKVDAINLVKTSQRPHPIGSYGLGSWNNVLAFFSIISVASNVGMLTFRTGIVAEVLKGNAAGQWIFFSVVSVFLALLVALEKWVIPDVPDVCLKVQERQRLVEAVLVRQAKCDDFEELPPDTSDDIDADVFPFDPSKEFVIADDLPLIPLEGLQWEQFNDTA